MVGKGSAALVGALLMLCPPALGAFPGDDGRIAFSTPASFGQSDIYVVNPDGSGLVNLTNDAAVDRTPAWSPDGKQIAFTTDRDGNDEVYVMNANGSAQTRLTTDPAFAGAPAWSPDGTKIAFQSTRDGDVDIWVVDADGSDPQQLTSNSVADASPSWAPDGERIVFSRGTSIHTIAADGTDERQFLSCGGDPFCGLFAPDWSPDGNDRILYLRPSQTDDEEHVELIEWMTLDSGVGDTVAGPGPGCCFFGHSWSPTGDRVAFAGDGLQIADPHGNNVVQVPTGSLVPEDPDWQPVIHKEFPRPKGATPLRVSLVVSFNACGDGDMNRVHGPPLAYPSCGGSADYPRAASPYVTVGAPDWNGATANSTGSVRLDAQLGNRLTPEDEADVRIAIHATDVRCYRTNPIATCGSDNYDGPAMGLETGRDYNGELRGRVPVHLTDENNSPFPGDGTGPGTVQGIFSFYLPVLVPCAETPSDITIGSTCSVQTTADAVIPGLVPEQKRSLWGVGQISVSDGGADGDADTTIDNFVFLKQGLFVP